MLLGEDQSTTCVWNACDPYTTRAVQGVEGHGQRSNCGRTNKDGIDFVKADREGFERYLALYHAPQDAGGCHGCRFFVMCKGQCPGGAIDGDWRNRSSKCGLWMALFERFEAEIVAEGRTPISLGPIRHRLEQFALREWAAGRNAYLHQEIARAQEGRPRMIAESVDQSAVSRSDVFRGDRLKHVLPDFTRISWVSDAARAVWEPRLGRIGTAWAELEWRSVASGLRRCALTSVSSEHLVQRTTDWAAGGLSAMPVAMSGTSPGYASTVVAPRVGEPFEYRVAVGALADVAALKAAIDGGDDATMGRLLGFPECCIAFFRKTWVNDGCVDTTWAMAANGGRADASGLRPSRSTRRTVPGQHPVALDGSASRPASAVFLRLPRHGRLRQYPHGPRRGSSDTARRWSGSRRS